MKFEKGHTKVGGKEVGSQNKVTKLTKEIIESVLEGRQDDINEALDKLRDDPAKFIDAISKLLPYVIAKKTELTGKDGKDLIPARTLTKKEAQEYLSKLEHGC